jgi:hypothetical protein
VQKITIIAVLLSAIVLSIAAELVSQDYLQKVHPEIEDKVQANVLKLGSFSDYIQQKETIDQAETTQEILDEAAPEETPQLDTSEFPSSVRVETLIRSLDIPRLQLEAKAVPSKLFDSFQISKTQAQKDAYIVIKSDGNIIASIEEIITDDEKKSKQIFEEIKAIVNSIPSFNINQTNQFGENSFYINPNEEIESAFVVIHKGTLIYAVAYQKAYHEQFKAWFELLL